MIAMELIARALPYDPPPEKPCNGICCVTGVDGPSIHRDHAIKDTFTNRDMLKAPESDRVSVSAWRVLTEKSTRMSSWICGTSFQKIDRKGVRDNVIGGVSGGEWVGYATTSYKKHGSLLAPVNSDGRQVWLFETLRVDCSDREKVLGWWSKLREAQDSGIHRPLIESLDVSPGYIAKIGLKTWVSFESWAKPKSKDPLFLFLVYLLPSMEELKTMNHKERISNDANE